MGNKGFTFGQIAAMLLVLVGLVAFVVLTTSQISKAGGAASDIVDSVEGASKALPSACEIAGGQCIDDSTCDWLRSEQILGCPTSFTDPCCAK